MASSVKANALRSREHIVLGVLLRIGIALLVAGAIFTLIFVFVIPRLNQTDVTTVFNELYPYSGPAMNNLAQESQDQLQAMLIVPKNMRVGLASTVQVLFTSAKNLPEWRVFYARNGVSPDKQIGSTVNKTAFNLYFSSVQIQPTSKSTGNSFANFFGTGYDLTALASLNAPPSDIAAISPGEQSFEQYGIVWEWIVTPKIAGQQMLSLNVNAIWKPQDTRTHAAVEERQLVVIDASTQVTAPIVFPVLQSLLTGISQGITGLGAALAGTSTIAFLFKSLSDKIQWPWKKAGPAHVPASDPAIEPEDKSGGEVST